MFFTYFLEAINNVCIVLISGEVTKRLHLDDPSKTLIISNIFRCFILDLIPFTVKLLSCMYQRF